MPGETAADGNGHGTHTASTVGGTGAASGGTERGVAPGAALVIGKVLSDKNTGEESWVIAGMEWAAAQGSKVVNMSLSANQPSDGTDPVSQAVDRLSASTGTLFVVAAGNRGAEAYTCAPGAADAALTVAAVNAGDALAGFSTRGPRYGDYGLKPELAGNPTFNLGHRLLHAPPTPPTICPDVEGSATTTSHAPGRRYQCNPSDSFEGPSGVDTMPAHLKGSKVRAPQSVGRCVVQLEKVEFEGVQETMLMTLYARASHSCSPLPILRDRWAEEAVSRINYDFAKVKLSPVQSLAFVIRSKKFDLWTTEFLANQDTANVLYLGCGLDSRVYRVNRPANVCWYDLDYPEVVSLRRRLYPDAPQHYVIGATLEDTSWLADIPNDQPTLIIAEGVTMYLTEDVIRRLLRRIVDHFPVGEIAFDAYSRRLVRGMARVGITARRTGASFHWGIDRPDEVEKLEPRLCFVSRFRTSDLPGYAEMPFGTRVLSRLASLDPVVRGPSRPLLYRFSRAR